MKRSSTSIIISEVKIKTTIKYHLTSIKVAITKSKWKVTSVEEDVKKSEHLRMVGGWDSKIVKQLWKTVWRLLKQWKVELP